MCEYPGCKAKAEYEDEYAADDSGEKLIWVSMCPIHYHAISIYNEDRDNYEFGKLTKEDRRKASQLGYRLKNPRSCQKRPSG